MAIAALQIPSSNINNLVDQSQWSSLANLGNVYKQAQEDAAKQNTLSQLGNDPAANASLLIRSGVPSLAQLGLTMQGQQTDRAERVREWEAANRRAEAGETRTAADWEKKGADEEAAAKLIAGLTGRQPAPAAPPSPFPAAGAPPLVASPPVAQPPAAPVAPPIQQAVPLAPGQMPPGGPAVPLAPQAPPVAPSPIDPSQLAATTAAAPPSVVDRIAGNLTSGQPAAAAGISRDQLAELYRNPITRPIATAFLQKQFSPGEWKYEKTEDGRIIAVNSLDPTQTKDVTPPTASGAPTQTKQEREVQGYYEAGIKQGLNDTQAKAFALNKGKLPSEDLSVHDRKAIDDNDAVYMSANTALENIGRLQALSPKAFQGFGASTLGAVTKQFGPGAGTATAEYNNIALRNVIAMVKSAFPRPTEYETKLMNQIETGADMPREQRDDLLKDLSAQLQLRANTAQAKSEAIRGRTYYKPGGGDTATSSGSATTPALKWSIVPGT